MLEPPILPNHICTSSGCRWYGTGARYSISCRAMSVSTPLRMLESSTAVDGASSPGAGTQNARTRASSRSFSIDVLFTWLNASRSPHRRWTGMCSRRPLPSGTACVRAVSVTGELAVGGPVRTSGVGAQAVDLVRLVRLEVALEPVPPVGVLVGAFVREDVRRDAVEEPPVVRDHHGAPGELQQRVLERLQRLDVEVVGGLVEEQQVAALLQRQREVQAVALTTGEDTGRL